MTIGVGELERLREAVGTLYRFRHAYNTSYGPAFPAKDERHTAAVEREVQTHLINGTNVDELVALAKKKQDDWDQAGVREEERRTEEEARRAAMAPKVVRHDLDPPEPLFGWSWSWWHRKRR